MKKIIEVSNLAYSYSKKNSTIETPVLNEVNLEVNEGDFVTITGASGSGKSTLLNVLGLLLPPSSGQFKLADTEVGILSSSQRAEVRGYHIGMVFQSFNLVNNLSVRDNILLPLLYSKKKIEQPDVQGLLEKVGLGGYELKKVTELSGGQQQRVAIARALVNKPDIILADEPTGNLDQSTGNNIIEKLIELNEMGTTILMVTHDKEHASRGNVRKIIDYGNLKDND